MRSLLLIFFCLQLEAHGSTWIVNDSIQDAVTQAKDGDTLLIQGPKVFHEHVIVNRKLSLIGRNSPVLDADGNGTVLLLQAPGIEVQNLVLRNGGNDLGNFDASIMVNASGAIIKECQIEDGGFGIFLHGAGNCLLEHNLITGNSHLPSAKRGNGIHLWKSHHNEILHNVVKETRDGLYLSYADNNLISGNCIEHTRFGIHYMFSHKNRLLYNTLTANAVGATLMFARDCLVEGNFVYANKRHGILLKQVENSRIAHNTVVGQNRGFFVQQAAKDVFEENLITENDIGLYLSNGSEQNCFVANAFIANTDQIWQPPDEIASGQRPSNLFYQSGCGNYWSDYTGVDSNGDGVGDTPYHETDVFGYIVERHPEVKVLAFSPAVLLLRKGEELLPLLNEEGLTDPFPMMKLSHNVQSLWNALPISSSHKGSNL